MKRLFIGILLALSTFSFSQNAGSQRISVTVDGLFPFDPLSGRYVVRSLPSVATYVEAWRAEGCDVELKIVDSLSFGYKFYCQNVDTTLIDRVLTYLDASLEIDTTFASIDVFGFGQSKLFNAHFDADIERIKRFFATPIAVFDTTLVYDPYAPCAFSALFHAFQIEVGGADLSIFAPSHLEQEMPSECYIKHIVRVLPYDNELVVVMMTGRELRQFMEWSYSRHFYTLRGLQSDLLRTNTPSYLYRTLAPTPHTINLTKPDGRKIENWPLANDTIYSVAMNSFMAKEMKSVSKGNYKTLFINWLIENKGKAKVSENTSLQPARWVEQIRCRERRTIFGK